MPKIAAGEAPAMPSPSKAALAFHGVTQSFTDLLERANSSPSEASGTKQNSAQGLAQEDHSPVGSPYKRDAKSSDSKVSDSQGHGGTASRAPLASSSDKAATDMAAQPTLPPALSWNTSSVFTPGTLAAGAVPNDKDEEVSASDSEADTPLDSASFAIQTTLSPSLSWNAGINGSAYATVINGAAPNDEATSSAALGTKSNVNPDSPDGSSLPPRLFEEVVLAEPQPGTTIQDAAVGGSANTSDPKAVASLSTNPSGAPVFGSTTQSGPRLSEAVVLAEAQPGTTIQVAAVGGSANTSDPRAVASLSTNRSGAPVFDSTTQFGDRSLPSISLRNPSRGPVEIGDEVHKSKAGAASAPEQVGTSPNTVPPKPISLTPTPDPGKIDLGGTKGTRDKLATDKSGVSGTQDRFGTSGKTSEVAGSEKAQPGRDWAPFFAGTSATNQNADTAAVSAVDLLPSFSITGTQSSPVATDGKNGSEVVPSGASDQQPGKLEHSSTGVAEAQVLGETAAVYPTSLVQSAKLVERIGESELRLGIRAGEFGSIDIRTSMVHNQFTAEISVERGELGRVMAAELSGLQSRLTEQGVPVASITVQNHTGGSSTASDQQNPRGGQQPYATNFASAREQSPMPALVAFEGTAPASRLDIHM